MGRLDSWLNCFVPLPAPVQVQQGICCLLVQLRSVGQHSNTFLCALCLPTSQTKNCNSELTQWGDLKIIGLKPVNDGFLGSPAYVGASRAHFQPVPCNCQKSPKSREGKKFPRFQDFRCPGFEKAAKCSEILGERKIWQLR